MVIILSSLSRLSKLSANQNWLYEFSSEASWSVPTGGTTALLILVEANQSIFARHYLYAQRYFYEHHYLLTIK